MGNLTMNGQTVFEQVGTNRPTTGTGFPAGHIVQVKSVNITDKITLSMDNDTFVDVPGLSLTITVSQGNSVLIMSEVTGSGSQPGTGVNYATLWWYILDRDGTQIANSYDRIYYVDNSDYLQKQTLMHIDSNLSSGTYVYKIRANQDYSGSFNSMTINQTYDDDATHPGHTNMTIMEIVGSAT